MRKDILICSIIAVVILVLVSFTGVVGYQTTKSSTIAKASPLFSVRSKRAIDKESKDLSCEYVGKGEDIKIPILKRNNITALIQKVKTIIGKIDDKSFYRCVQIAINQLNMNHKMKDEKITTLINQLKSNSNEYNLSDIHKINNDMILDGMPSFDCYFPDFILGFILFIIYWAIVWYLFISPSFQSPC
ncbi:MAG: hypothetical protein KAJ44_01445 [Thermoplasmatales archaeon]|nr:hypothetical protein [Thermoplasmatales archaeon]